MANRLIVSADFIDAKVVIFFLISRNKKVQKI